MSRKKLLSAITLVSLLACSSQRNSNFLSNNRPEIILSETSITACNPDTISTISILTNNSNFTNYENINSICKTFPFHWSRYTKEVSVTIRTKKGETYTKTFFQHNKPSYSPFYNE